MKRIICFLLTLALAIASFTVYAEEKTTNEKNVIISASQINCLKELDIIPSVSTSETAYVTREMQAVTLMKLLNITSVDEAIQKGLIDNLDNGETDLQQYVRFGEVARGMLIALGYKSVVEMSSGDFSTYITLAEDLKISRGLGLSVDDYVTEQEFALMILRLMDTPMVEFDFSDKTLNEGDDENTILSKYHDVYYGEGIITSNHYTNLSGPTALKTRTIIIDGSDEYNVGDTNAKYLVGYKVEYYYKLDEVMDEKTLLWVYADEEENGEIYLEYEDIEDYNALVYRYYDGNRVKNAVINNSAAIIYNGVSVPASSLTKEQMMPEVGEVTLLNTDGDSKYDVVIIMDYYVATIGYVNNESETINFSEDDVLSVVLEGYKDYDLFDKDYEKLDIKDLKTKMIAWVAESTDKSYITLLLSEETIKGSITGKRTEEGIEYLKIDDKEYPVKAVKSPDSLTIGTYGTFSLGFDGSIANWTTSLGKNKNFVYTINAFIDSETDKIMMKVFDDQIKTVTCVENLKINGIKYSNLSAAEQELKSYGDGIMIVETTEAGEIKSVETSISENDGSGRPYVIGSVPKEGQGAGTLYKKAVGNLLCNYFGLADDCVVFMVPEDRSEYDKYKKGGPELIKNDTTVYGITGYKTSEEQSRCVAAVYDRTFSASASSAVSRATTAITEVSMGLDANDEAIYTVTGKVMYTKADTTFYVKDEELLEKIKEGNIIRVDTDASKVAVAVNVDYNYESGTSLVSTGGAYGDSYRMGQGKIIKKWDDGVLLDTAGIYSYIQNQWVPLGVSNMWTWKETRNGLSLESISTAEINVGDKMIYWQGYGGIDNILIIKN